MLHTIHAKQFVKTDLPTLWDFISSPKNLSVITPAYMGFEMINDTGNEKMYAGQIIEYYIRPVAGIKLHWVTEITHVQDKAYFVDEQRMGPYKMWHHKHFLEAVEGGVNMTDLVHYKAPLGFLGDMANALFIRRQLNEIFDYRFKKIDELFNQK